MSDAHKCDRCTEFFTARQSTRRFQLREDAFRNSTTPTVNHQARDLCPDCYAELKDWWNGE